jgi:hypothetical protein
MLRNNICRALPVLFVVLASPLTSATSTLAAEPAASQERWSAYGFNIIAPASVWPMLELLHTQHFD